jgi:hypothetical protein
MVKVSTGSASLSARQRSQRPAKPKSGISGTVIAKGCLRPGRSPCHSKKPVAGTTQRRDLIASRKAGFASMPSLLALIIEVPTLRSFAQNGTRPQRSMAISRVPWASTRTTGAACVGAMLKRFCTAGTFGTRNV